MRRVIKNNKVSWCFTGPSSEDSLTFPLKSKEYEKVKLQKELSWLRLLVQSAEGRTLRAYQELHGETVLTENRITELVEIYAKQKKHLKRRTEKVRQLEYALKNFDKIVEDY